MSETEITKLTGLQPLRRQKLIRYYARLSEPERLAVHAEQRERCADRSDQWQQDMDLLSYCMLLLVLEERYRVKNIGGARNSTAKELKLAERLDIERIKGKRHRLRPGAKRDQLLMHKDLIRRFHDEEGMSWREIAAYLFERFKLQVSYSHVRNLYLKNLESAPGRPPAGAGRTTDSQ